ncbi:MAG: M28 family metallopeptidase [Bacteroidota bacterium]
MKYTLLALAITSLVNWTRHNVDAQTLSGFTAAGWREERASEEKFDQSLQRDDLRSWMYRLSAHPHHIGTAYGKQNADFIAAQFRSWGYDTSIETFYVLFPTPKASSLELLSPVSFAATLEEPSFAEDTTSKLISEELPLYNAYSIDGDVTGELVYVNYGVPEDYDRLAAMGVDVKGKIVIARYGGSWRGIKPKVAGEHGAIGCIIYSDPRDDGYFEGDVYPKGPYRNDRGGQRGSVLDMPLYSGDPLTPGVGAVKNAKRLAVKDAPTLTKIPVLPISYHDALPFLKSLTGQVAPEPWRGALPITYHCGPGPAVVHLKVQCAWDVVPIHDVIARMRGSVFPDEWIIRGNHHDGWVFGAGDPVSGQVSMMEEARGIGLLAQQGWKPKRTLIYCAWDGEEEGLFGSTEWVETHYDELKQKAVVYVNSDGNGRGFLGIAGSHTLQKFMNEVARDVKDPEYNVSVGARLKALMISNSSGSDLKELRESDEFPIGALGSGSDYSPFLQHLGIAALNIGYGGEDDGGSYHSAYDSFDDFVRFGDPDFAYGITLAQTTGRVMMRFANADVLPFDFSDLTKTVGKYVKQVIKLADDMRDETAETNRRIRENDLLWSADPTKTFVVPAEKPPVPYLNFSPLQNAFSSLEESAHRIAQRMESAPDSLPPDGQRRLNRLLMGFERTLTLPEGLPGRPWYIHELYAPGMYTGYGVKTLPAIREAIELRKWDEVEKEIGIVSHVLDQSSQDLGRIPELVKN